ncbi:protein of unknown function [Cupriavidus taiwanensis]|uniref:Uncharacterized protein n=1 Tax=Cupriavidus taiwanensis TaxID=164546 RepID=A0A7Z7JBR6_9BURK|nr:protein of unknown function [Cupriavidus taiwanensis]SOZ02954.1 hypothetical protein CBM2597_A110018 [Cupriavidus taiwanensis]SOZ06231.1 hypothetical protein CBM2595_A80916 [Cupriavidus taiwanensis]SPC18761.1 hypothetical protein CBM2594_A80200 [Cupriavidus taiwanensis]SPD41116.1 protein of unknown function [Cupriavidus taiwanensis]
MRAPLANQTDALYAIHSLALST